jgi:hypothetical protein
VNGRQSYFFDDGVLSVHAVIPGITSPEAEFSMIASAATISAAARAL